jgi:eukaryotic-like serine/threonine-protein kinase
MNILDFLSKKPVLRQLLFAIGAIIGTVIVIMLSLRVYTHHGEALAVPDLKGMQLNEAGKILEVRHLRYQVIDSVFDPHQDKGSIVAQNPPAGFRVKEKRTIFLTLNANSPEMIKMPDLSGISLRQAKPLLESMGLMVGRIRYQPDIATNVVLSQQYKNKNIEPGTSIVKGALIDLVLGMGSNHERTSSPELIGLSLDEAKRKLTNSYLNIGKIIYDNTIRTRQDSARAKVWKQFPEFKENLAISLGSSINIWLTIDATKVASDKNEPQAGEEVEETY